MSGYNMDDMAIIASYEGSVIGGNKIGRTLGIPTVNIPMEEIPNLPVYGVYAARVLVLDTNKCYEGVANLGVKPTVYNEAGQNPVCIEVNLFDFDGDLYDMNIRVELLEFIRSEMKFENLDALKEQINKDIIKAKAYFE